MDNEAMFNAFVKDRSNEESNSSQSQPQVNADDIPVFEFEIEDPTGEMVVPVEEFIHEPALQSDSGMGGNDLGIDVGEGAIPEELEPSAPEMDEVVEQQGDPVPVEGFDEYKTAPEQFNPEQPVVVEEEFVAEEPPVRYSEFEDFRREPQGFREVPQSSAIFEEKDLLTNPPYQFEGGGATLPPPEVFNSYPPEVQRKIMEWADRDLRARRDDESRRQDAVLRANIARDRTRTIIPVVVIALCVICAAFTGVVTKNAFFVLAFLLVAVVFIVAMFVGRFESNSQSDKQRTYTASKK